MSLISAEQAKSNAEAFDLNRDQVLDKVNNSIAANSKVGKRDVVMKFLKTAVSNDELDYVKGKLRDQGYDVSDLTQKLNGDSHALKIEW